MTLLENLESAEMSKMGAFVWSANLTCALGNPSEWEFTGEVTQAGPPRFANCACGHPIMDCFHIAHKDGRRAIVGSTCIEYFQDAGIIYGELTAALESLKKRIAEAKKAAKRAADEIKVAEARAAYEARYDTLLCRFRAYRERGEMAPKPLWIAMASYYRVHRTAPDYQRPCDYLKWYAKQMKALENI